MSEQPMTASRALYFMERFKREEKLLGPNEQAAVDFVIAMLSAAPTQPTKQEQDLAYREAAQLATDLFKKHYASNEEYATGQVVWGLCDSTAGIISQIDNMVSGLVMPQPAQAHPDVLQACPLCEESFVRLHDCAEATQPAQAEQPPAIPRHGFCDHPDDEAAERFCAAMKWKLAEARRNGRGGWETCSAEDLSRMLREHVEKGDPRDVANFCMFLWAKREAIAQVSQPKAAQQEPVLCINPSVIDPATGKVRNGTGALTYSDTPNAAWSLPLYTAAPTQPAQAVAGDLAEALKAAENAKTDPDEPEAAWALIEQRHLAVLVRATQPAQPPEDLTRKCLPNGLRYKLPPLELTGHQVVQFADMVRAADSLDATWRLKELEPLSAYDEGGPCPGGVAVTTEGQPGYALLPTQPAQAEQPKAAQQEPVGYVDERVVQWLSDRQGKASAHITTTLSAVKRAERPMPLYTEAAPQREPMTDEQERAIHEAHCNEASDEYFNARPQLDSAANRRIFYAGHRKAWITRGD